MFVHLWDTFELCHNMFDTNTTDGLTGWSVRTTYPYPTHTLLTSSPSPSQLTLYYSHYSLPIALAADKSEKSADE